MMVTEFVFEGETLTLATEEEMTAAIMNGRHVSRVDGISRYLYKGRHYLVSDNDLAEIAERAKSQSGE